MALNAVRPSLRRPGLRDEKPGVQPSSERYAPGFTLYVNGVPVGAFGDPTSPLNPIRDRISSIDFEESEDIQSEMRIRLEGFIIEQGREIPMPIWVESTTLLAEGNIVWLYGGYGGVQSHIGGAEIVKRKFGYGEKPFVEITARDPLHRMANEFAESAITYRGLRSSDIVKKIGRKAAYSGVFGGIFNVDNIDKLPIFTPRAEVQKQGETDYHFIRRMAEVRGWSFFSRFNPGTKKFDLFYGPDTDKQQQVFVYEYNAQQVLLEDRLVDFDPEIDVIDQHTQIDVVSFDEKRKKKISHAIKYVPYADGPTMKSPKFSGGNSESGKASLQNVAGYRFLAFGVSKKVITNRPFKDEKEAKKFLIQWARQNIKNAITAKGRVVGNEALQVRQTHIFKGIGQLLGGTDSKPAKWYWTKVKHKFTSGGSGLAYNVEFDGRKVIDWLPDDDITLNLPALQQSKVTKDPKYVSVKGSFK